jgi:hypothetical protein
MILTNSWKIVLSKWGPVGNSPTKEQPQHVAGCKGNSKNTTEKVTILFSLD